MIALPPPVHTGRVSLETALAGRNSTRTFSGKPLSLHDVAQLLWAAQGEHGPRRKRTTPSAGALYPLEIYLAAAHVTGLDPGIYRYHHTAHSLEPVIRGDRLSELAGAALHQSAVKKGAVCLVIGAVYDRTAAKYGSRARRYVHMESGHAAQNIYLQAFALDLGTVAIGAFEDERVKRVMGMKEDEFPLYIMPVGGVDK